MFVLNALNIALDIFDCLTTAYGLKQSFSYFILASYSGLRKLITAIITLSFAKVVDRICTINLHAVKSSIKHEGFQKRKSVK
uniref:Putative secreted protein n=1 Tax=Amblyomma triste TaxID=251400 RepID=A0A023G3N4_AMBTT